MVATFFIAPLLFYMSVMVQSQVIVQNTSRAEVVVQEVNDTWGDPDNWGNRCLKDKNNKSTCVNTTNCNRCSYTINVHNCEDCHNVNNVTNCIACRNVNNSRDLVNVENSNTSILVKNTRFCSQCFNVSDSSNCVNCRTCIRCNDCTDCIGYRCSGLTGCRNSRWRFEYWEPPENDTKAWNCTNPLISEWMFRKDGYGKPKFLSFAERNDGLEFCRSFEGNRTCCNRDTTSHLRRIYEHYRSVLNQRANKKVLSLRKVFEQYHELNYTNVPKAEEIKKSIGEQMRKVKIIVYSLAKEMIKCGKVMLMYVSSMLCLGCMPDWRWQPFIPRDRETEMKMNKDNFDPEKPLATTVNLSLVTANATSIGRQICEEFYQTCKPVLEKFNSLANDSAEGIGLLAKAITDAQDYTPWDSENSKMLLTQKNVNVTREIAEFSNRKVEYYGQFHQNWTVDHRASPRQEDKDDEYLDLEKFKAALRKLGPEYPYDPVAYYNFNPSINFEIPVMMSNSICQTLTLADNCYLCSKNESGLVPEAVLPYCEKIPDVFYEIEDETNRQYRDFSAFFFQVKVINSVIYEDVTKKESSNSFNRTLLFPPYREGEFHIRNRGKSFEERKKFYLNLEDQVRREYEIFNMVRKREDEFKIWNDEYWMNFIYDSALRQGRVLWKDMYQKMVAYTKNVPYKDVFFLCDYDGSVKICDYYNRNDEKYCVVEKGRFESNCDDCHFSKVRIEVDCRNDGCITCLYIGEKTDTDEPMDKCYIRAYRPFYDLDTPEGEYFAPFFRETAPDEYYLMEEMFDLKNEKAFIWNVAKISQWFYKLKGSNRYSVLNARKVFDNVTTFVMPDMSNLTHYQYEMPCDIEHPINECKRWVCYQMIKGFFPSLKILYNPQIANDTDYEHFWGDNPETDKDFFDPSLIDKMAKFQEWGDLVNEYNYTEWNITYGSADPEDNDTFFDILYWGQNFTTDKERSMKIAGIDEETDIRRFVEREEDYAVHSSRVTYYLSLFIVFLLTIVIL